MAKQLYLQFQRKSTDMWQAAQRTHLEFRSKATHVQHVAAPRTASRARQVCTACIVVDSLSSLVFEKTFWNSHWYFCLYLRRCRCRRHQPVSIRFSDQPHNHRNEWWSNRDLWLLQPISDLRLQMSDWNHLISCTSTCDTDSFGIDTVHRKITFIVDGGLFKTHNTYKLEDADMAQKLGQLCYFFDYFFFPAAKRVYRGPGY